MSIRPDLLKAVFNALKSHRSLSQDDFLVKEVEGQRHNIDIDYRYDTTKFSGSEFRLRELARGSTRFQSPFGQDVKLSQSRLALPGVMSLCVS